MKRWTGFWVYMAVMPALIIAVNTVSDAVWQQVIGMSAFVWFGGLLGYVIGWINGHDAGWRDANK